jgi:hypothetical protein
MGFCFGGSTVLALAQKRSWAEMQRCFQERLGR